MLQPVIQQLSNYFLNPLGLAALIALVPLIIFYLMRPSPEEKVMPSMTFFHKDKKSGRLQKALKILQRNMMLLLHVLMITGLAAAIANPYIMGEQRPKNAVIVIDNSASMNPVFDEVKTEAISELGNSNTVVLANDEAEVELSQVSTTRAREFIRGLDVESTGTDIVGAIQRGKNYDGKMFIASDFDQTQNSDIGPDNLLKTVSASRPLNIFNPSKSNSWGIVDLQLNKNNATAFIQNYRNQNTSIDVEVDGDAQKLEIGSGKLRKLSFTIQEGRNTLELEKDSFSVDNTVSVISPSGQDTRVTVISDQENQYLMKALEIIDEINPQHVTPSEDLPETDVYIIGKTENMAQINSEKIISEVKNGKGLILYAQRNIPDFEISDLPVTSVGEKYNTTVRVSRPVSLETGNTSIFRSRIEGESGASPEEALVFSEYGDGGFAYFNFGSDSFKQSLMYPVFWKNTVQKISGKASIQEVNRKTGSTVLTRERAVELSQTGFQVVGQKEYAVNLLNGDESGFENFNSDYRSVDTVREPKSIREIPLALIALLGLLELVYLGRKGEIP